MSDEQPPPKPSYAAQIWGFTLGLLIFGGFGYAMFFAGAGAAVSPIFMALMAVTIALLTAGSAIWAMLLRKIALGSGLLVGYAIAAVASGGECTFLNTSANYGFLSGAVIYLYGFVLAIIIGMIASIISAVMNRRRGPQ
jgi:hypothetical protein